MHQPLRLRCDHAALASNFQTLQSRAGVPVGAAVKADAYGLGAKEVVRRLFERGCRDFFVSSWWEAAELTVPGEGSLAVLHGFGPNDVPRPGVRPVLNSAEQIARWRESGRGHLPCDVMIDTGMNRLGLRMSDLACASGLHVHTLHSHLACADEDHPLNALQLQRFREACTAIPAQRYSLANSAGIFLSRDYSFDLVRPGLALYGGIPRSEARTEIAQVALPEAQVIQVRTVPAGESVGYNATFVAPAEMRIAVLNIGYADGFWRALGKTGAGRVGGRRLPIIGRISMDLVAINAGSATDVHEGDWIELEFDLEQAADASGMSQYELLTGLGRRFERRWS